jgi:DNA-binding CsgD family transcriptional regulator
VPPLTGDAKPCLSGSLVGRAADATPGTRGGCIPARPRNRIRAAAPSGDLETAEGSDAFSMAPVMVVGRPPGAAALRGRRAERVVLDGLLDGARERRSGVLVVRGEAGIGKTALLEYAIASASDMRVLRAVGVESEMELAYASLHQLLVPMLDGLERLLRPQRDALAVAFGLRDGPAPDRFQVGLAALSLLSEAADERPVLCVIDDAQWLDRASAQALAFVARRLLAEGVVMLFAAREPGEEFAGLPQLRVSGLGKADARELLRAAARGPLDDRVAGQLVEETRGNPLALSELPRGLSSARLAAGFGLLGAASLSGRIEESYRDQLEALPVDTRRMLVVAAAEPTGDPTVLWRAGERLGITASALEPAESAGLLDVGARVRFRHPLVRSAVYGTASLRERRSMHQALAEATDARTDPDRRAWHLAESTPGPDEDVAAELERAAARAQARGGLAAAAAFLERAVALSYEPSRRAQRALTAARAKFQAGALDDALELLETAESGAPGDGLLHADAQRLGGQIAFAARRGSDAAPLLLAAARELETVDPGLARTTYLEALAAAMFAGRLARGAGVVEISEAALGGPPPPATPQPSDLLLQGLAVRFTETYAAGAPVLKKALDAFQRETDPSPNDAQWLGFASLIALFTWDDHAWKVLSTRQLAFVRETGALSALPLILTNRSSFYSFSGEPGTAALLEEEQRAAAEATGIAANPIGPLSRAALSGREAEFSELIRTTVGEVEARGEGLALTVTEFLSAYLYNGLGRYEAALAAALPAEPFYTEGPAIWALTELIEAAVRCGQPERARCAFDRVQETTRAAGTDWALGVEARLRALLSEGDDVEELYTEAISRLSGTLHLPRTRLLYGEWLRRAGRPLEAREQLRRAHEFFRGSGAEAFAARAERELLATGEHVRKRSVEARAELSAQEAQIARLARDGLSNREIAARLFISPHTVHHHLRKVFAKLNITSRNQLRRVPSDNAGREGSVRASV